MLNVTFIVWPRVYSEPVAKNDIEEKEEKVGRHGENWEPAVPKSLGVKKTAGQTQAQAQQSVSKLR